MTDLILVYPKSQCGPGDDKGQPTPYKYPTSSPVPSSIWKTQVTPGTRHRPLVCDPTDQKGP